MRAARRRQAGFTLIEVIIVLAITLIVAEIVYKFARSSWLLYQTETHAAERGFSGLRSVDDMAVEIARAGFGLGNDAGPVFPGRRDGVRAGDAITLRSNPEGVAGMLGEDLEERDRLVHVDGAPLFAVGDEVLLADAEGALERAQVARVAPDALAFRSRESPDGQLEHTFLVLQDARVLKVREVAFYLKTDSGGAVVLARKATGQAEQILARYVGSLRLDYLDEMGQAMDPGEIGPGRVPGAVRIGLSLLPNPDLPPVTVPSISRVVSLEPQSATVAFDTLAFNRVGVAAVIGQDPASTEKKVRMHAWRKTVPLL